MAVYSLSVIQNTTQFSYQTLLDEDYFFLTFAYYGRLQAWYFTLISENDIYLIRGRRVVPNTVLTQQRWIDGFPKGDIFAVGHVPYMYQKEVLGTSLNLRYVSEETI